jgi:hypothetical protein
MADRNILDLEMWRKVFAEVMELRYDELKQHPKLYEVLNHFEGYFSKFDTNLYKFSLDQKEAISLLTLREKCTDMYKNRKF